MSILSHFPENETPRDSQITLLKKIESAFNSGKKFVIAYAPTGCGKSFVAKTLANSSKNISDVIVYGIKTDDAFSHRYSNIASIPPSCEPYAKAEGGGAFVLTITKNLQEQYKELFSDAKVLKGKNNYKCTIDTTRTVDIAPCVGSENLRKRCEHNKLCSYYNARNNSIINKFSILNYKMFSTLPKHIKNREYMICDEASELPNELISIYSRKITFKTLKELHVSIHNIPKDSPTKFLGWLNDISGSLIEKISSIERRYKKKTIPDNIMKSLMGYRILLGELEITISMWDYTEYVVDMDFISVRITPVKANKLSQNIFDHADKVLLMSGTIIDHARFARNLGIKEYEYVEVESEFDPKKAPIYTVNTSRSLNRSNIQRLLPVLASEIQEICKKHKNEKGIIHTHTNDITKFLYNNLKGNRFLYRMDDNENDYILDKHSESDEPTVLVSPSLSYGIDLKGDLAKFQIIVKAAFLPLNDARIKKLFDEDPQWYTNEMLNTLIQACGRGVRSKDDECVTYILDGNITTNVIRNKSILPKYFVERFI
jgi:ATP-dependent DNA helicase DinG